MRLPLSTLEAFNAVARNNSLRGAADVLGVKPSTISHQLKALEEKLGTAVFIRTTRSVQLTEAGNALYRGTKPAFDQIYMAYERARISADSGEGGLKLEVSDVIYDILLGPVIKQFCLNYPELAIELSFSDGMSNFVDEGLHAGFYSESIVTSADAEAKGMMSVEVMQSLSLGVFATPAYLKSRGTPTRPSDLLVHDCIRYRYPTTKRLEEWNFLGDDVVQLREIPGKFITSTRSSQVDLCLKDLGVIYTLKDYCVEDLKEGRLVSLMEDCLPVPKSVYVCFPSEYRAVEPLRLLLEYFGKRPGEMAFGT